jgi:hypothetical protein
MTTKKNLESSLTGWRTRCSGHDEPQMAQDQDAEEGLAASSNNGNDKSSVDVIDASQTIPETSTDLKATYNRVLFTL